MSPPRADLRSACDVFLLALATLSFTVLIDVEKDDVAVADVITSTDEDLRSVGIDDHRDPVEVMAVPMRCESFGGHETGTAK